MVKVDKEACIGCGSCAAICDNIFMMKDGKAVVVSGKDGASDECIKEAIDICPVDAIIE